MKVFSLIYYDDVYELPTWLIAVLFLVPLTGGLTLYFYKTRHARSWRKGVYPISLKFNQDNLLEAYLALGSLLILTDYQKSKSKTQFINAYFNRYFTTSNYNFADSLLFSMKHPIKIETVANWLNKNLEKKGERAQVIFFLTGLAFLDEGLSKRELQFLQIMNEKLGLDNDNLVRIIETYKTYHASKKESKSNKKKVVPKRANQISYAAILGVSENATSIEIKKAYRKLVKEHHPDVFAKSSDAQQKLAKDNFIQIQEAYDYFKDA